MGSEEIDETPTGVFASGGDPGRLGQRNHQLVDGASPGKGMCFCTLGGRGRKLLTGDRMTRWDARRMIVRRAKNAGLLTRIGCRSFRATGITVYLLNAGLAFTFALARQGTATSPRPLARAVAAGRDSVSVPS